MNILILANNDSGLYKFRKELIQELIDKENKVFISLPEGDYIPALEKLGCYFIRTPFERRGMNPFKDLKLLFQYIKIIKKINPNIVLTYTIKPNIYGGIVCRARGIRYIENITGLGTAIENNGLLSKVLLFLYRIGLKNASQIFFQNKENLNYFKANKIVQKGRLIPGSGVNLNEHSFEEYPEESPIRFLFIGRIMKDKGIDELLSCARQIKLKYSNVSFDLIGEFDEKKYRAKLDVLEKEGIIRYLGQQDNVHIFIQNHHAVILPSYHEGLSNVLLEAAACGRPVLATQVPGCRETYDDGISGIGFQAKDSIALISAVEKFINLPYEKKRQMGICGRQKAMQEFDRRLVIDAYMEEIYRDKEKDKA